MRVSSVLSPGSICSYSTTSVPTASTPASGATSWRSSRSATPRGSTLIASQLPVKAWHDLIGEPTFADAILDRLVHNAYRLELEGQRSMREPEPDGQAQTPMPSAANPKPAKGARK